MSKKTGGGEPPGRTPVVVVDRIGWSNYRGVGGAPVLPEEEFEVRLVTTSDRVPLDVPAVSALRVVSDLRHGEVATAVTDLWVLDGRPAEHLVAVSERLLITAGMLRDQLGLEEGSGVANAVAMRDKLLMMSVFAAQGVPLPDFRVFTPANACDLLARHGKVVVKPRLGTSSAGVHVVDDAAALTELTAVEGFDAATHVVEEFVDGELYHVDAIVEGGVVLAVDMGRTVDSPMSFDRTDAIRDVALAEGILRDRLVALNERVVAAMPWHSGATHLEIFVRGDELLFLEVAARSGGGGIWAGYQHRTGRSLLDAVVRGQTGRPQLPAVVTDTNVCTGYVMLYRPAERRSPDLARDWVLASNDFRGVRPPGPSTGWADNSAMVAVVGASEGEVSERLDEVVRHWRDGTLVTKGTA